MERTDHPVHAKKKGTETSVQAELHSMMVFTGCCRMVAAVDVAGTATILSGGGCHSHVFQRTWKVAHLDKVSWL